MMNFGGVLAVTIHRRRNNTNIDSISMKGSCTPSKHGRFTKPDFSLSFIDALKILYESKKGDHNYIVTLNSCNEGYLYTLSEDHPYKLLRVKIEGNDINTHTAKTVIITEGIMEESCSRVYNDLETAIRFVKRWHDKL